MAIPIPVHSYKIHLTYSGYDLYSHSIVEDILNFVISFCS